MCHASYLPPSRKNVSPSLPLECATHRILGRASCCLVLRLVFPPKALHILLSCLEMRILLSCFAPCHSPTSCSHDRLHPCCPRHNRCTCTCARCTECIPAVLATIDAHAHPVLTTHVHRQAASLLSSPQSISVRRVRVLTIRGFDSSMILKPKPPHSFERRLILTPKHDSEAEADTLL